MSFSKNDQKEINKLKSLYNSKLKELKKENNLLKLELEDRKETLKINQSLLYCTIQSISDKNDNNIQKLIDKGKIINDKISLLIEEKAEKEKKIDILKKEIPGIQKKIVKQINTLTTQSEQKNKEIFSEENIIKKLESDLAKLRSNAFFKKARTEIYVASPNKKSLEINLELINTKNVFQKASKLHQEKKKKAESIWREEKNLKDEMVKLKDNLLKEKEIDKKLEPEFLREIGYNLNADNYEKEEEEESEDSDSSSDDSDEKGGDKKKKEKELNNLKEKFSKLEKKYNELEKKINEYKKKHTSLKIEIEKLKNEGKQ